MILFLTQSDAEGSAEGRRGFCGMLMGRVAVLGRRMFLRNMACFDVGAGFIAVLRQVRTFVTVKC